MWLQTLRLASALFGSVFPPASSREIATELQARRWRIGRGRKAVREWNHAREATDTRTSTTGSDSFL